MLEWRTHVGSVFVTNSGHCFESTSYHEKQTRTSLL